MKEVAKKYVSKDETSKEYIKKDALSEESVKKKDFDNLQQAHDDFRDRLGHITEAFRPATQHALFETAIYEFIDKVIAPDNDWADYREKIQYGVAVLCRDIMENILDIHSETKTQLARTVDAQSQFSERSDSSSCAGWLAGLAGLTVYIKLEEQYTLRTWSPTSRNDLSQNGCFLDSLYASLQGSHGRAYIETKQSIKNLSKLFKREANNLTNFPAHYQTALQNILDALEQRGVPADPGVKEFICNSLDIVGPERVTQTYGKNA